MDKTSQPKREELMEKHEDLSLTSSVIDKPKAKPTQNPNVEKSDFITLCPDDIVIDIIDVNK
jgi:hypothetical protein